MKSSNGGRSRRVSASTSGTASTAVTSKFDDRPLLVNPQSWMNKTLEFQRAIQPLGNSTERLANTHVVLNEHMHEGSRRHVYMMGGAKPVGLMKSDLLTDNSVYIYGVVTHPDTKGVGGALIEEAVNTSVRNGGTGTVRLQYLDGTSHEAYRRLGFVWEGDSAVNMILSPANKPEHWERVDGGYRLKKSPPRMLPTRSA